MTRTLLLLGLLALGHIWSVATVDPESSAQAEGSHGQDGTPQATQAQAEGPHGQDGTPQSTQAQAEGPHGQDGTPQGQGVTQPQPSQTEPRQLLDRDGLPIPPKKEVLAAVEGAQKAVEELVQKGQELMDEALENNWEADSITNAAQYVEEWPRTVIQLVAGEGKRLTENHVRVTHCLGSFGSFLAWIKTRAKSRAAEVVQNSLRDAKNAFEQLKTRLSSIGSTVRSATAEMNKNIAINARAYVKSSAEEIEGAKSLVASIDTLLKDMRKAGETVVNHLYGKELKIITDYAEFCMRRAETEHSAAAEAAARERLAQQQRTSGTQMPSAAGASSSGTQMPSAAGASSSGTQSSPAASAPQD